MTLPRQQNVAILAVLLVAVAGGGWVYFFRTRLDCAPFGWDLAPVALEEIRYGRSIAKVDLIAWRRSQLDDGTDYGEAIVLVEWKSPVEKRWRLSHIATQKGKSWFPVSVDDSSAPSYLDFGSSPSPREIDLFLRDSTWANRHTNGVDHVCSSRPDR